MGEESAGRVVAVDFVHLRVHSHFSLLTAPVRIQALVNRARQDGQSALALTDSGNLFGAIEFYKTCRKAGIKPVMGMTAFLAGGSSREPSGANNPTYELTLLAESQQGWDNLKALSSHAFLHGFHYRPRIDKEILRQHTEGLIALSGGLSGEIDKCVLAGDLGGARRRALELQEILGRDNFYLELLETGYEPQAKATAGLLQIQKETGIPVLATNDVHYLDQEDWIVQDILLCIRDGRVITDTNRFKMGSRELHFKTREEMETAFAGIPEALTNSVEVARRCNVEIDFDSYHLPVFSTNTSEPPEEFFVREVEAGAVRRYGEINEHVRARIDDEVAIILKLEFASYFLITADFISRARELGIPVGPGRGSAAGSIVAYCLGITDLDPLKYNLIFERFLNVDRISMPDIDVDFCGSRRDEVIDYVRDKYGHDNVSQIITFGTMASRGVLRDVGRVLEVPLAEVDRIAKKVPQGPGASLRQALAEDEELKEIRDSSPTNKRLFDLGLKLEGLARHSSIHAAGVVISDKPLGEYVPLARNGDDIMTQWQMTSLEEVGLLKVDFLGLKTLTILQEAVRLIRKVQSTTIDLCTLPLDDKKTFELMTAGHTLGVFQLESAGMRDLLARLQPDSFEDIIAVLALYRPGPLGSGMVDMFVDRKHGREQVEYPHESVKEVLKETYGIIVYQEQVMRIANVLAGFTMNQADSLRKAMGKKKPEVMAKFKNLFIEGAREKGHKEKFAREIFETMEYFAGYGFNKSHSAAYALLTYQTAYLKAHYPTETLAAHLTVESGNTDKVKEFVDEARQCGIALRPPNVNEGRDCFDVEDGVVLYGFQAIKGVGQKLAEAIGRVRDEDGPFRSMGDFCERLDPTILNKTALEALCKVGAFDSLGVSRKGALESMELVMRSSAQAREDRRKGQGQLFAFQLEPDTADATGAGEEWDEALRLAQEKEALGFYLSGHPYQRIGAFLSRIAGDSSASLKQKEPGTNLRLAGMITGLRIVPIRSGQNAGKKMARFQLEDLEGSVQVTCFARNYEKAAGLLEEDAIVCVRGKLDARSEEPTLLLEEVERASAVVAREVDALVLRLGAKAIGPTLLDRVARIAEQSVGEHRLFFEVEQDDGVFRVSTDRKYSVRIETKLLDSLAEVLGPDRLSFTRK